MTPASSDHGTALAALLVGQSAPDALPLAPGAQLLVAEAIGVLDDQTRADTVAIVRALDWAAQSGARVVALSLEGHANQALAVAIEQITKRANLVAAAGNGGPRADAAYPAAYTQVMAVAAVDARLRPYRHGTRGEYVELSAPGVAILSAGPGSSNQHWTGSSFAVPFAVAAILRARAITDGDPEAARRLLHREARDLGALGQDNIFGFGLVQAPGKACW